MKIRPSTRHAAIRKIFSELELDSRKPFVETDLLRAWNHTGLRYTDLKMVMRDLIQRRQMEQKTVGETVVLQLRNPGSDESSLPTDSLLTRSLDWVALRRVRSRSRAMSLSPRLRNRATDRY